MADLTNEERIAQQIRPVQVGNASLAILGEKFNDLNADGIRQLPDELWNQNPPVSLPQITILLEPTTTSNGLFNPNANGVFDPNPSSGEIEAFTNANGAFSFGNLAPGTYRLTETVPAGFRATTPNPLFVTVSDRNVNNVLFGNSINASLATNTIVGCKYLDLDDDGFRDGNEPGIKNVRIYLDGSDGSIPNGILDGNERSTLTDKNGKWSFDNLADGTYRVREVSETRVDLLNGLDQNNQYPQTLQQDFPQTTPPDNVPLLDVTVAGGQTFACAQVGDTQFYKIVVNKFQDLDRNGQRNIVGANLEPPVSLVPFILDTNRDGKFNPGEEIRFTDSNGNATFEDLRAGNYPVLEIFNPTLSRSLLSPAELSLLAGRPELTTGVSATEFRPGNLNLPVATTPNPLVVAAPGPLATPQSTISRNEPFLVADNYTLQPQDPKFLDLNGDGFQQLPGEVSIPLQGIRPIYTNTPLPFPALNPSPSVVFSPIAPNNTVAGNTGVGNTRPNINVFKYDDQNANGRYDPEFIPGTTIINPTGNGETPIGGVTVSILNNNGVPVPNQPPRQTNADGKAVFQNLEPGTYTVQEVVPDTYLPSTPASVTFAVNTEDANVTFGNTPKSTITGCKFEDFNQNGYRDGNEPGISGITVYLDANNNGTLDEGEQRRTTDQFGTFAFDNLEPGTYSLREDTSSVPSNFRQTTQPLQIVLGPNQTFTCALIGNTRLYDLLVPKFQDDNRDGIRNGNEQFLNDVPFALDLNENGSYDVGEPLVRTGADGIPGTALFKDLLPGTYSVLEVFNDPRVPNPFPIRTGPNPVSFTVPGSGEFTVPSPVRPPEIAMMSIDPLTGGTGVVTASSISNDPLTNPGSSVADLVQASSTDSLLAPETAVSSFVDIDKLKESANSLIATFLVENGLEELLLTPPAQNAHSALL